MGDFSKAIDMQLIEKLRNEPLFQSWLDEETLADCLLEDMLKGEVFPSIGDRGIRFYYRDESLFTYDGTFKSCARYAFVPQVDAWAGKVVGRDETTTLELVDVDEAMLVGMKQQMTFQDAYKQIKERCGKFDGMPTTDISAFYRFSFAAYPCERYFVLNINIWWGTMIHLLLMDAITGRLLFCQAKPYSLMTPWTPAMEVKFISGDLGHFRNRIAKKRDAIIAYYTDYARAMQALTGIEILAPTGVCGDCGLLIYGFDEDQKNGKLKKIMDSLTKMGWPVYAAGGIGEVDPETLFTKLGGDAA